MGIRQLLTIVSVGLLLTRYYLGTDSDKASSRTVLVRRCIAGEC